MPPACGRGPFPTIPPAVVRRAVLSLLAIAMVSGLVFNAFTLLLPKLMEERLASSPGPAAGGGAARLPRHHLRRGDAVHRGADDRHAHAEGRVHADGHRAGAGPAGAGLLDGWAVLPVSALVAAAIFGQVTVNETMTARYVAPELRAKLYSIRFTVGFLGAACASPLVGLLHAATGNLSLAMVVLAGVAMVTLLCAAAFPNRPEELRPELWAKAPGAAPAGAQPAE
jgi:hypothetical protein